MWQLPGKCNMKFLPLILTELWTGEYSKCPVRDKTNTEESPNTVHITVLFAFVKEYNLNYRTNIKQLKLHNYIA